MGDKPIVISVPFITDSAASFEAEARAEALHDHARIALHHAVYAWWLSKRPVEWDAKQHAADPHVYLTTQTEKDLADALMVFVGLSGEGERNP